MSTITSSRATAPRASGAATSGPARPSSTSASARLLLAIAVPVSGAEDGTDKGPGQSFSGCNLRSVDGCARIDQTTIDDDWERYRVCHARAGLNDPNREYCVGPRSSSRKKPGAWPGFIWGGVSNCCRKLQDSGLR